MSYTHTRLVAEVIACMDHDSIQEPRHQHYTPHACNLTVQNHNVHHYCQQIVYPTTAHHLSTTRMHLSTAANIRCRNRRSVLLDIHYIHPVLTSHHQILLQTIVSHTCLSSFDINLVIPGSANVVPPP